MHCAAPQPHHPVARLPALFVLSDFLGTLRDNPIRYFSVPSAASSPATSPPQAPSLSDSKPSRWLTVSPRGARLGCGAPRHSLTTHR